MARVAVVPALLALGVGAVPACGGGGAEPSDGPPPLATSAASAGDDGGGTPSPEAGAPVDAAPIDAGSDSVRWTGSLAASKTVDFGGSPYCKYRVTLQQIEVDLTMTKAGAVVTGKVKNLAVEAVVPPCSYPPQDPSLHEYSLAAAKPGANGAVHLDFAPFASNHPKASLALDGPLVGSSSTANATLEWHRTDQPSPLDWRVTVSVPLVRR